MNAECLASMAAATFESPLVWSQLGANSGKCRKIFPAAGRFGCNPRRALQGALRTTAARARELQVSQVRLGTQHVVKRSEADELLNAFPYRIANFAQAQVDDTAATLRP